MKGHASSVVKAAQHANLRGFGALLRHGGSLCQGIADGFSVSLPAALAACESLRVIRFIRAFLRLCGAKGGLDFLLEVVFGKS